MFIYNLPILINEYGINEFGENNIINQTYINARIINTSQKQVKQNNQEYVTGDLTLATSPKHKDLFKKNGKITITFDGDEYDILKVDKIVDIYGATKYLEIVLVEKNGN